LNTAPVGFMRCDAFVVTPLCLHRLGQLAGSLRWAGMRGSVWSMRAGHGLYSSGTGLADSASHLCLKFLPWFSPPLWLVAKPGICRQRNPGALCVTSTCLPAVSASPGP
jgi:hypothetical protein